ncbi:LytR/AlgR family response regulator transcription factor [Rubrivivax rivuli]|uniref:Response regulator transcription factor n=1 Tax=Rubrivivax rivuli TaxID=1862385 RepID=A0A437RD17_9BURK|nr:LytTR family DNA-binding domain-containing protein [Rubrivivax rivuli]RVU44647.1 response regulator transcription factor [Rubrivivax rivuli]
MNVLIVDDEDLARLRLRALLQALPEFDVNVVGEAGDAAQALAQLNTHMVDAVLLDIRMPGLTPHEGLHLAARLRAMPQPPAVIFVSAHAEHALKAFELEAVDYLTKPVRTERLRNALQRVQQRLQPLSTMQAVLQEAPALVVSDRGRVLRLPLPEVLVLKAGQKYVTLRTPGHEYVLDDSLSELEQRLAALGGNHLRIHRNALVARHAIRELALREGGEPGEESGDEAGGWAVRVAPLDEWLSVSRRQLAAVRAALAGRA